MIGEWISESIKRKLEKQLVFCTTCNKLETLKFGKGFTTYKCGCGITIYYPPNEQRPFGLKRFISKKEYLMNKKVNKYEGRNPRIPTANNKLSS